MQRRQIGFLAPFAGGEGLRVVVAYEGEAPGRMVDITAAVVVGGWLFEVSLVPRDHRTGDVIAGAMRPGDVVPRLLTDEAGDWEGASVEQVEAALAVVKSGRERPTTRQVREAKRRMRPEVVREVIVGFVTGPDGGDPMFRGWGDQFAEWEMDAGPLDSRGQKRVVSDGALDDRVAERRGYRDRKARFETTPRPSRRVF